ncbi:beta-ketoacyl synthase domain-containing protein [Hypomontagnella monticulosa]|nr:beta-ketoacyl synthase domain-containing protein [Hypomontagnella monticulosa]
MTYKPPLSEPIAVVGSSCRFAGDATSPTKLWDVLCEAPDLSREVPPERFNAKAFYHPDGEYHGTTNSIRAYWLNQDHRVFDCGMFNITPKEAEAMDPQQRLLLEVVYEAMESAGYDLKKYSGENVAVFSGVMTSDYDTLSQRDELSVSQYYATGNARSIISNRISYFFNFHGPSMTIDTACSSSLVALHQAVLSLRSGESTMACVTGVNIMMTPEQFLVESGLHMLSPTGKSRMWDASADGYARGEGVAALLIKPLSRALAEGDQIAAIIRETGVNSDGRTKGITLPNPEAQTSLIKETYRRSGLDPMAPEDQCQYFEAHGTGTPVGDPREAEAIYNAFFGGITSPTSTTNQLLVGSVKTVLGHTEGAAGLAGLLKVIQAMKHGLVTPNLHLDTVNPDVKPFCTRLRVPTSLVAWPQPPIGQPKRASVNSFGFGGANGHVIVEDYDPRIHHGYSQKQDSLHNGNGSHHSNEAGRPLFYLPLFLSAASQKSLRALVALYRDYLLRHPEVDHDELAWAIFSRRTALPYRLAISVSSRPEAFNAFDEILAKTPSDTGIRSTSVSGRPKILGVFTGQGAQWATMSRSLFRTSKVYRDTIRDLDKILKSLPEPPHWSLEEQIMAEGDASRVDVPAVSQPLCTAVQVGLVKLLASMGISFHAVVGHSSGEIAAAYAAGRISERDAILISYYRGHVAHLATSPEGYEGSMVAAAMSEQEAVEFCAEPIFNGRLHLAAINSPSSVTLSGDRDAVQAAHEQLTKNKKFSCMLRVNAAYHSPHMLKPAAEYIRALQGSDIRPTAIGNGTVWISSVHGRPMEGEDDLNNSYWNDNMVNAVRFSDAVTNTISRMGLFNCALEVGPHPALKGPVRQINKGNELPYSGLLDRTKDDTLAFSSALGFLWSRFGGQDVDFGKYLEQSPSPGVVGSYIDGLPSYPWDHTHIHYRESRISRQYHFKSAPPHELLGVRTRDDNEHELRWRNILRFEKLPWVEHHSFQGQALLPASAYCVMALDAAKALNEPASMVELHKLEILSGINIDRESEGVETLFTLAIHSPKKGRDGESIIEARVTLASCPVIDLETTSMRLNMTGYLTIHLGAPTSDTLPPRITSQSEALTLPPESFYRMMEETGLAYTGPFRALTSIQRRYNYCSTTLRRRHPEDTTALSISPATLDTCLQSAFLTYASPGDGALWTSFLPIGIDCVRFNLKKSESRNLIVDTHLTNYQPSALESKAKFSVNVEIFDEDGENEIQVEGLTVAAIAHTQPKDDYELYLGTVMDIDPTHEIARAEAPEDFDPILVESCFRVATYFIRSDLANRSQLLRLDSYYEKASKLFPSVLGTIGNDSWVSDTKDTIDHFIQNSDYCDRLALIRRLGTYEPNFVLTIVGALIDETHYLTFCNRHVGRIVKQVAHRYPQMNILDLAGPDTELRREVLTALGSAFSSFTLGAEMPQSLKKHIEMAELRGKKVHSIPLELTRDLKAQLGSENVYDLALLSDSELEHSRIPRIMGVLRTLMRAGGFLIVVSPANNDQDDVAEVSKWAHWPDLKDYGFVETAKHSNQSLLFGYSIMVRQLTSPRLELIRQPYQGTGNFLADHLLIIGDMKSLMVDLEPLLAPLCRKVSVRSSLEAAESGVLINCTIAIMLEDFSKPMTVQGMTGVTLDRLQTLLRPRMKVLWLTREARFNPDHAATFGFTRTIAAEIPSLMLQMLDLGVPVSHAGDVGGDIWWGDIIVDNFISMAVSGQADNNSLWTDEREIHYEGERRLIPRVKPLDESNSKVNSLRRVITGSANSLRDVVEVVPRPTEGDMIHYEARTRQYRTPDAVINCALIRVDYSSVEALRVDIGTSENPTWAYVVFGYDMIAKQWAMAISASNASYVWVPQKQVQLVTPSVNLGLSLIARTMRYLIADAVVALARNQFVAPEAQKNKNRSVNLVLVDADLELIRCIREIAPGSSLAHYTTTRMKEDISLELFLHPRSSEGRITQIFPLEGAVIVDFNAEEHTILSKKIQRLLPTNCRYCTRNLLFHGGDLVNTRQSYDETASWRAAVLRASRTHIAGSKEYTNLNAVSLPDLQMGAILGPSSFRVIDWKANRDITITQEQLVSDNIFRADRTYVLAGLTKDLGQTLCYLLTKHGARNIVMASRNPRTDFKWVGELARTSGASIGMRQCDITDLNSVKELRKGLDESGLPEVGGIVNGAMVLDDRVFAQMDEITWQRVMKPKAVGSQNLNIVFHDQDLEFFIMTSSFAAIGGHSGQSNYAAANMYMNGVCGQRRREGLTASVLNIGVIYGLGFLQRERGELYAGLEREGYPPISERDIHHMFLEAVITGRDAQERWLNDGDVAEQSPIDLTTGLSRFDPADPNLLHWQQDPRFSHYTRQDVETTGAAAAQTHKSLKETLTVLADPEAIARTIQEALTERLQTLLRLPAEAISPCQSISELGVDSLVAVEIRGWIFKTVGTDVSVIKLLGNTSILKLCKELADQIVVSP